MQVVSASYTHPPSRLYQRVRIFNRKVRRDFTQRPQRPFYQYNTLCVLCEKLGVLCGLMTFEPASCRGKINKWYGFDCTHSILFFFIFFSAFLFIQEPLHAQGRIHREIITIRDTIQGFRKEVVEENNTPSNGDVFMIPYSSLETIKKIELSYFDERGKPVLDHSPAIEDIQVPSKNFFTCLRAKSITLKGKSQFRITYTSECRDLLLLTSLPFSGFMQVDTFSYELRIPSGYHLKHDLVSREMLSSLKVDSIIEKRFTIYHFTAVPKIRSKPYQYGQKEAQSLRKKFGMVRLIITPEKFIDIELNYFNTRLKTMFKASGELNEKSRKTIDSLAGDTRSIDSVIDSLIIFIRKKVKYLDMEVGYGSFIPDNPNDVLNERQGDCKGMANLLCLALRSKGIEAYLALTSSLGHQCDMNFPSFASGNHMICSVKRNDQWIFLDPTDKEGIAGKVSPGIQGRTAFIVGYQGGIFVPIPLEKPEVNAERFSFELQLVNNFLQGNCIYSCTGGSMEDINRALSTAGFSGKEYYAKEIMQQWIPNSIPSNILIHPTGDTVSLSTEIRFGPSSFIKTDHSGYLSLSVLPPPLRFIMQQTDGCDILLGHTISKRVLMTIDFGKDISIAELPDASFHEGKFKFTLSSRKQGSKAFLEYSFSFDDNIIREEEFDQYRRFDEFIDKTLKRVITVN